MNRRVGTAMATLALVAGMTACRRGGTKPSASGPEADVQKTATLAPTMPDKRMVYPWSVVAGGVDSPLAMQEAMEGDPIVQAHYAGLRPGDFKPQRLAGNKQGYVSYRIRDKIYWTKRIVTLAAGETVLTDGKTLVRGRCGNLYSETPRMPLAPVELEPAEAMMDQPVRAAQLMTMPEFPVEKPVETEKFENPKLLATNSSANSVLPPPEAEESLPPVWVAGGIPGPGGGVMGIGGGGGGGGSAPSATPTTPENPTPVAPVVPLTPVTPETAPPLVYVALTVPPSVTYFPPVVITTPQGPEYPIYVPPLYPPVPSPQPPSTWNPPTVIPPTTYPPTTNPPTTNPPENPPPPVAPPPTNPPVNPPPIYPPAEPPIFPPGEPPVDPPPDVSVPEPGAWVLAILGIAAIAFGSIRRKT